MSMRITGNRQATAVPDHAGPQEVVGAAGRIIATGRTGVLLCASPRCKQGCCAVVRARPLPKLTAPPYKE